MTFQQRYNCTPAEYCDAFIETVRRQGAVTVNLTQWPVEAVEHINGLVTLGVLRKEANPLGHRFTEVAP